MQFPLQKSWTAVSRRLLVLSCVGALLSTSQLKAQCTTTPLSVNVAPTVTGTAGTVGAAYRHANVIAGVDAVFTITSIQNTASLTSEDDAPGTAGKYLEA